MTEESNEAAAASDADAAAATAPLVRALDADTGVTCAVGAGGKKSTLYALARRLSRAVVTSTVRIPPFADHVASVRVTDDPASAVRAADAWPVGVVPARDGPDRFRGYPPDAIDRLSAAIGDDRPILVKADGARSRLLKAPGDEEPQLPASADTVVPVASVRAVGRRLDEEAVHRPRRVAAVADRAVGDRIEADDVAAVLASERGGRKAVPASATVVPVVNMADDPASERVARRVAAGVLDRAAVPRVVVARMTAADPVVDVVR